MVLSRHDRDEINDGEVIEVREDGSLPHPGYDSLSTNNDFMLVFLKSAPAIGEISDIEYQSDGTHNGPRNDGDGMGRHGRPRRLDGVERRAPERRRHRHIQRGMQCERGYHRRLV